MLKKCAALVLSLLLVAFNCRAEEGVRSPRELAGPPPLALSQPVKSFKMETMYEHVNGEAELFRRFGATTLEYSLYEKGEVTITADLVTLPTVEHAYGLYRLYTACPEELTEERTDAGMITTGDKTAYGYAGNLFFRINAYRAEDEKPFFRQFAQALGPAAKGSKLLDGLAALAARPCGSVYIPDDVDPLFASGPGWRVTAPDTTKVYLSALEGEAERERILKELKADGSNVNVYPLSVAAWSRGEKVADQSFVNNLKKLIKDDAK